MEQPSDFSAPAREVMVEARPISEQVWTSTGWLIGRTTTSTAGAGDVIAMRPGLDTMPRAFLDMPSNEYTPSPSPDGRWLAYTSNESGRFEVYVTSFPERTSAKWQVSSSGGVTPLWSPRGDEIFFLDLDRNLVSARVTTRPAFALVGTQRLFNVEDWAVTAVSRRGFDVSPDGQRFLAVRLAGGFGGRRLHVIENWIAEAATAR
jgi:dipeptidyl aminopeptidase/acylaminoacyl peptidase